MADLIAGRILPVRSGQFSLLGSVSRTPQHMHGTPLIIHHSTKMAKRTVVFVGAAIFSHPIHHSEIPATATYTIFAYKSSSLCSYTDPQYSRCVRYWQRANHTYAGNPPVRIWEKIPPVACAATAWISPWSNHLASKRAKLGRRIRVRFLATPASWRRPVRNRVDSPEP
jgi:hypothetical protein